MHIVFVTVELATASNSSGGLASFTANMARIFAANGHDVTILVTTTKKEGLEFDNNIPLVTTYVKKSVWNMFDRAAKLCSLGVSEKAGAIRKSLIYIYKSAQVRKKIKEINEQKKIDIVHYCNLSAVGLLADRHIPHVVRISGMMNVYRCACLPYTDIKYEDAELLVNEKLMNYDLKKSRYIISPSNLYADILRRKLGIGAAVVESPFVLNEEEWDYSLYNSILNNKRYIIHYGSLRYFKGTHVVAQLAREFLHGYPDMYLVMAGNSEELLDESGQGVKADEFVKRCAGEYGNRVVYAGRLVRGQLYPLVKNAELCLLPYRFENLSNACIEAMAMGKIVIGTDGASFEQLIEDRVSGFLCERDNPDSYLHAVNEALGMSDGEKESMGAKALGTARRLEPHNIYRKYLEFYEKVIREW